ncbi:MAG TPA: ADP-ribosylglycohydrolase family protein, partial [Intrasporangiaceae bacterium]|nr:ADP-ribosylglycohydrolase family protein [Intrasporangiaceae bacterium]
MEQFTAEQMDRAVGVLIGQACGDALGVPYEFGAPPSDGRPVMKGGGLGNYAPGEWSDDTQMALCIAEVAATGADLTDTSALDDIAVKFEQWYATGPADIGIQTQRV